ncbi:MAG: hypothetical protein COA96_08835 [SAR86 cluster bacterium]|uniref:N-acetyltransferase domain-containing protein n=1 Tax=SAR86 cluster bacterium TaxID=2030880 RepID=A0A2A5AZM6_9GAMM|nr:MAG: hypothetical protein COA96_08835 [SAR86 cluster bacterium]
MNLVDFEQASRQAWPALEEQHLSYGVLRYAQGVNRRANSLALFPGARFDSDDLIETTERFFAEKSLPPIVRILKSDGCHGAGIEDLDRELDRKGYVAHAKSKLMVCDLSLLPHSIHNESLSVFHSCNLSQWLPLWHDFSGREAEELDANRLMLQKIEFPHSYLCARSRNSQVVSCGLGVLSNNVLGLFAIATSMQKRKQGYGRKIVTELMKWGISNGARFAYLQVELANESAIRLYQSMGFRERYSYWYRVKTTPNRIVR